MIIQFVSGGDLFERIISLKFNLTENMCIYLVKQICEVNEVSSTMVFVVHLNTYYICNLVYHDDIFRLLPMFIHKILHIWI